MTISNKTVASITVFTMVLIVFMLVAFFTTKQTVVTDKDGNETIKKIIFGIEV
jgi:hypothetical protein